MTERTNETTSPIRSRVIGGFLAISCAVAMTPATAQAKAMEDDAAAIVNQAVERTVSALEDSTISDAEADSILELVDVERVAQFSLGNHWQKLNADQKTNYLSAFRIYAKDQLKTHLSGLSQAEVEVSDVTSRGDKDSIVETLVTTDGERQTVSWRVMDNSGLGIVDIEVQDVWFAIEQRAQFDAILDKNGGDVDALIKQISS